MPKKPNSTKTQIITFQGKKEEKIEKELASFVKHLVQLKKKKKVTQEPLKYLHKKKAQHTAKPKPESKKVANSTKITKNQKISMGVVKPFPSKTPPKKNND